MSIKRIVVFSDTHGRLNAAKQVFHRNKDVETFIFLGDGQSELDEMRAEYPDKEILSVKGNCDIACKLPDTGVYTYGKVKIIFTHGHNHGVNFSLYRLLCLAKENCADIALYGHTHCRDLQYVNGIYMFNPGSAARPRDYLPPSYGFIDITDSGIFCSHVDL